MKKLWLSMLFALVIAAVFCGWFYVASNYDESWLAGTYSMHRGGVISKVLLRSNETFTQEWMERGQIRRSSGTWRRIGEGGVVFSDSLIRPDGYDRSRADQSERRVVTFYGVFEKTLTVFPSFYVQGDPPGTLYRKQLFR